MNQSFLAATACETISCPVCEGMDFELVTESGDYEYKLPGIFYISRCKACGMILQNPRPPFSEILRYYTEKYEPYRQVGSSLVQTIRHFFLIRPRINLYRSLIGDSGKIVDVGCSVGSLLHELSSHGQWELLGVEPVEEVATMGVAQGLNIIPKTLEDAEIPNASIDLAIMNHVLEHLPNPSLTAKHVFNILKPGGYFVGEIPSPQCFERMVFGKYWGGYHLPRHLAFFSPKHIKQFLENIGFQEIEISYQQQPSSVLLGICNYLHDMNAPSWLNKIFNPHSLIWLIILTPTSTLLKFFGSAPIIHFRGKKPLF